VTFRQWLQRSGTEKAALARDLGVSRQTVLNWSHGRSSPRDPLIRLRIEELSSGQVDTRSWAAQRGGSGC